MHVYIHTYITLHYITFHCITLHYIALRCIKLHYTLHMTDYITWHTHIFMYIPIYTYQPPRKIDNPLLIGSQAKFNYKQQCSIDHFSKLDFTKFLPVLGVDRRINGDKYPPKNVGCLERTTVLEMTFWAYIEGLLL